MSTFGREEDERWERQRQYKANGQYRHEPIKENPRSCRCARRKLAWSLSRWIWKGRIAKGQAHLHRGRTGDWQESAFNVDRSHRHDGRDVAMWGRKIAAR